MSRPVLRCDRRRQGSGVALPRFIDVNAVPRARKQKQFRKPHVGGRTCSVVQLSALPLPGTLLLWDECIPVAFHEVSEVLSHRLRQDRRCSLCHRQPADVDRWYRPKRHVGGPTLRAPSSTTGPTSSVDFPAFGRTRDHAQPPARARPSLPGGWSGLLGPRRSRGRSQFRRLRKRVARRVLEVDILGSVHARLTSLRLLC
jgi:hypothetical protein